MTVETVARTHTGREGLTPRARRADRTGETADARAGATTADAPVSRVKALLGDPKVRTHLGTAAGVLILAVLFWRLGTGVFLDGLRRIDGPALRAARRLDS